MAILHNFWAKTSAFHSENMQFEYAVAKGCHRSFFCPWYLKDNIYIDIYHAKQNKGK